MQAAAKRSLTEANAVLMEEKMRCFGIKIQPMAALQIGYSSRLRVYAHRILRPLSTTQLTPTHYIKDSHRSDVVFEIVRRCSEKRRDKQENKCVVLLLLGRPPPQHNHGLAILYEQSIRASGARVKESTIGDISSSTSRTTRARKQVSSSSEL